MRHNLPVHHHPGAHSVTGLSSHPTNHYERNLHLSRTLGVYLCISSIADNQITLTGELITQCQTQLIGKSDDSSLPPDYY